MAEAAVNRSYETLSFIEKYLHDLTYTAFNHKYGWLVSNASFVMVAVGVIIVGSFASLSSPFQERPKDYAKYHRKILQSGQITHVSEFDDTDDDVIKQDEYISNSIGAKYAIVIPFIATAFLLFLNYVIKNVDADTIANFFDKYTLVIFCLGLINVVKFFLIAGVEILGLEKDIVQAVFPKIRVSFAVEDNDSDLHSSELSSNPLFEDFDKERPYFKQMQEQLQAVKTKSSLIFEFPSALKITQQFFNMYISSFDIISILIAVPLIFLYTRLPGNHWLLSNFVAIIMAVSGILSMKLSNFVTGFIILAGFFFYDIYFVFGSDVMVNVAKGIKAPMMIKIPSGFNFENIDPTQPIPLGILGLGDIVLPGAFIALCLRYDVYKHYKVKDHESFKIFGGIKKTYFIGSLISYVIGLVLTFTALVYMNTAQPALLYLSPSLITGTLLVSLITGDFSRVFAYEDSERTLIKKKQTFEKNEELNVKISVTEEYTESEDNDYLPSEDDTELDDDEDFDYYEEEENNDASDYDLNEDTQNIISDE